MTALREAYELIRDPENWTTLNPAIDRQGESVEPTDPAAVRWCVAGAVFHCANNDWKATALMKSLNRLTGNLFPRYLSIVSLNDLEGHAAVMQVLEKAIVQSEGGL